MTVLRYTNRQGRKVATVHDTLADAAAAQVLDDLTQSGGLVGVEDLDNPGAFLPNGDVRTAMAAFDWRVIVHRPGHGHGTLSVFATEAEADAEVDRLAAIVGADRVQAAQIPAPVAGV